MLYEYRLGIIFLYGIDSEYKLCCVMFFNDVWLNNEMVFNIHEYSDNFNGCILCPDCVVDKLE